MTFSPSAGTASPALWHPWWTPLYTTWPLHKAQKLSLFVKAAKIVARTDHSRNAKFRKVRAAFRESLSTNSTTSHKPFSNSSFRVQRKQGRSLLKKEARRWQCKMSWTENKAMGRNLQLVLSIKIRRRKRWPSMILTEILIILKALRFSRVEKLVKKKKNTHNTFSSYFR